MSQRWASDELHLRRQCREGRRRQARARRDPPRLERGLLKPGEAARPDISPSDLARTFPEQSFPEIIPHSKNGSTQTCKRLLTDPLFVIFGLFG